MMRLERASLLPPGAVAAVPARPVRVGMCRMVRGHPLHRCIHITGGKICLHLAHINPLLRKLRDPVLESRRQLRAVCHYARMILVQGHQLLHCPGDVTGGKVGRCLGYIHSLLAEVCENGLETGCLCCSVHRVLPWAVYCTIRVIVMIGHEPLGSRRYIARRKVSLGRAYVHALLAEVCKDRLEPCRLPGAVECMMIGGIARWSPCRVS